MRRQVLGYKNTLDPSLEILLDLGVSQGLTMMRYYPPANQVSCSFSRGARELLHFVSIQTMKFICQYHCVS